MSVVTFDQIFYCCAIDAYRLATLVAMGDFKKNLTCERRIDAKWSSWVKALNLRVSGLI